MSQVITDSITFNDAVNETLTFGTASQQVPGTKSVVFSWTNGSAASQANLHFEHTYTLASSASVTLTLSALTDDLGRTVAFALVRKLWVHLTSHTDGDYLTLGGAATHAWAAVATFLCYDFDCKIHSGTAGLVVTSGSSDQLKITNSGSASITFTIGLAGA